MDLLVPTCRRQYPGGPLGLDRSWDGLFQPFPCTQRRRPSPYTCKVGDHIGLFEACSTFTGDYGLSARRVAKATRLSRRLRRFRYLHRRSDSYRLERPSCRVGLAPTEDQHLTRFTAHGYGVPGTLNAHGSSFQPSRPAIRCCFVDTSTGSDAPAMFPSNGHLKRHPLHSAGSFGRVPPPQRYYGTLRLPVAHLAALRCLRLAIPSFRPLFVPTSLGR